MRCAVLLLTLLPSLAPAAAPGTPTIEEALAAAFRAAGRPVPVPDKALTEAARALAKATLADGPKAGTGTEAVSRAISEAGGWDPYPRALASRTRPAGRIAEALAARTDLAASPATHYGVGLSEDQDSGAGVILLAERHADLEPFPRQVAPESAHLLRGRLGFAYYDARVFLKGPGGVEESGALPGTARDRVAAELEFARHGTFTVEVVAKSAKGPEVVALFQVVSGDGDPPAAQRAAEVPEAADLERAEGQVMAAIDRTRRGHGLQPLTRSGLLDSVAQAHAEEMARLGYFAHVSPVSGDVAARAKKAGFAYRRITENLGEASTALQAHQLIEDSPGHLANVLDSQVDLVGLGTARVSRGGVENVLLVEVFGRAQP